MKAVRTGAVRNAARLQTTVGKAVATAGTIDGTAATTGATIVGIAGMTGAMIVGIGAMTAGLGATIAGIIAGTAETIAEIGAMIAAMMIGVIAAGIAAVTTAIITATPGITAHRRGLIMATATTGQPTAIGNAVITHQAITGVTSCMTITGTVYGIRRAAIAGCAPTTIIC